MPKHLSVCLITLNEAADLPDCLKSVVFADEIIIVDSGSKDTTLDIAERAGARIFHRNFDNYAQQKNFAIAQATSKWVLILDADERLSPDLQQEVLSVIQDKNLPSSIHGYEIPFKHFFKGRWIRHGGQYPSYHLRLILRQYATYAGGVHETFGLTSSETKHLTHSICHYSYKDAHELWRKLHSYSEAEAKQVVKTYSDLLLRPFGHFVKHYFLELGFLDGWPGLIWHSSFSYYQFLVARKYLFS